MSRHYIKQCFCWHFMPSCAFVRWPYHLRHQATPWTSGTSRYPAAQTMFMYPGPYIPGGASPELHAAPGFSTRLSLHISHRSARYKVCLCWRPSPTSIKSHSFRIGAATHALTQGLPPDLLQKLGRWKSDSFKRYFRPDLVSSLTSSGPITPRTVQVQVIRFIWYPFIQTARFLASMCQVCLLSPTILQVLFPKEPFRSTPMYTDVLTCRVKLVHYLVSRTLLCALVICYASR